MANTNPFGTKQFFLTIVIVTILIGVSGIVYSIEKIYQLSKEVWKSNPDQTIYVSGTSKVKAMPDMAFVSYNVRSSDKDVKKASNDLSVKVEKAIKTFTDAGFSRQKIYLSQYQVDRAIPFGDGPVPESNASQNITIELRGDKDALNKSLQVVNQIALSNDLSPANNGSSFICLDFSDKVASFSQGRKEAVLDAHRQATDLVSAGGLTLGRVVNISDNMYGFGGVNSPYGNYCATQLGSGLTIDEQEVPVSVSVNFEVR